jgi:F-type H+-transporting ATPase subunit c
MNPVAALVATLNGTVAFSAALILIAAAFSAALSISSLGGKVIEAISRQPEMEGQLFARFLIIAALIEAIPMISTGLAAAFMFLNPFLGSLSPYLAG